MKLKRIYKKLKKIAENYKVNIKLTAAVEKYKEYFSLNLIPGPAGTMGQIFFLEDRPDVVIKFTTDSSEAKNAMLVYNIQNDKTEVPILTEKEKETIKSGIIKIYNVFMFSFGSNSIYIIEQEKGQDLPYALASKLMKYIGKNVSRQPDAVFNMIQMELSDPDAMKELTLALYDSLLESGKIIIKNVEDVDVGDLGLLLKTVRSKIDSSFKDFRPSNMLVVRNGDKVTVKLTDLGYGSGAKVEIPVISF